MRIAFPTRNWMGLDDEISELFAKSETFTIIEYDVRERNIKSVTILDNDAKTFSRGAGPIAVKILLDNKVDYIGLHEVGMGSEKLLKEKNIKYFKIRSGVKVKTALEVVLKKIFKEERSI